MPETGTSGLMSGVWKRSRSCFRGTDGQEGPVTPTRLCTTAPHLDSTDNFRGRGRNTNAPRARPHTDGRTGVG